MILPKGGFFLPEALPEKALQIGLPYLLFPDNQPWSEKRWQR
jgi:hypothetical protein